MRTAVVVGLLVIVGVIGLLVSRKLARTGPDEAAGRELAPTAQGRVTQQFDNPDGSVTLVEYRHDGTKRVRVAGPLPGPTPTNVLERVRMIVAHQTGVDISRLTPSTRLSDLYEDADELDLVELIFALEEHGRPNVVIGLPDSALLAATGASNVAELPRRTTIADLARVVERAPKAQVEAVTAD